MYVPMYFTRHAQSNNGKLTVQGKKDLDSVRKQLQEHHFGAGQSVSSPVERCRATAVALAPLGRIDTYPELDIQEKQVGRQRDLNRICALSKGAHIRVQRVRPQLVVTHDCFPVILALRELEARGVDISWETELSELQDLPEGHGVLVLPNNTLEHIAP